MTSEPDSTPRRRPPTIDLTATEVKPEKPAPDAGATGAPGREDGQGEPHERAGGNFAGGWGTHAISAIAGAAAIAAIACGLWFAGVLPPQTVMPPVTDNSATDNSANAVSAQLDKIERELRPQPADTALAARLANAEAQTKALSDSLAAINRRLDEIGVASQSASEHADAAAAAAKTATDSANAAAAAVKDATQNSVQRSDLDALAARIAALEHSIQSVSAATTRQTSFGEDRAARAAVAAAALRAVVERGAPFQAELAAVKSFGADQSALAALEPFAASGLPSDAELARELLQLMPSLQPTPAAAPASGGGFLGRLEANAKNLVRITPVGTPASDNPASAIARLDADATRADIAAALADIAELPPSAKPHVAPWVQKASARNAALAAGRHISAEAVAALTSIKTQ